MYQTNYNYKNIRVRFDEKIGKMLITVIDELEKDVYRETFVSSGEEIVYKIERDSLGTKFYYQNENGEFVEKQEVVFDFGQIINHVFGSSFEPYSRFSIDELKKQEEKLNKTNAELYDSVYKFRIGKAPKIKNLNTTILMVGRPCDIEIEGSKISAYEYKTIDGKHTFVKVSADSGDEFYHKKHLGKYEKIDKFEVYQDGVSRIFYLDHANAEGTQDFKEFTLSALLFNIQHSKYPEQAGQKQGFGF